MFEEDLRVFFDDFGEPVTVIAPDGGEFTLTGLYEAPYDEARLRRSERHGLSISLEAPAIRLPTGLTGDIGDGYRLRRAGVTYFIARRQDDGLGLTTLYLGPDASADPAPGPDWR